MDVGKLKSAVAAEAARAINPKVRLAAYEEAVGGDGEARVGYPFGSGFWEGLDVVANALDNVKARLHVDSACVAHGLPLLESGTSGTKGNTQVVLPGRTESYGSSADPTEPSIPVCTLKSFPYLIEHTLQWARDVFEGEFVHAATHVNGWLQRPNYLRELAADTVTLPHTDQPAPNDGAQLPPAVPAHFRLATDRLTSCWPPSRWFTAPQWRGPREPPTALAGRFASSRAGTPRHLPHETLLAYRRHTAPSDCRYVASVSGLLRQFPPGHRSEGGALFWGGTHRQPHTTPFDESDAGHRAFVCAAATLRGRMLGLPSAGAEKLEAAIDDEVAAVRASAGGAVAVVDAATDAPVAASEAEAAALALRPPPPPPPPAVQARLDRMLADIEGKPGRVARMRAAKLAAVPQAFEKDDDSNGHLDFITAASNLRAECYGIPPADRHRSKLIAGRIVPAIATTTAAVVGLSCLELLKLCRAEAAPAAYRNGFLNLALPLLAFSEPASAEEYELPAAATSPWADGRRRWTLWDRIDVPAAPADEGGALGELTLGAIVQSLESRLGLEISLLEHCGRTLGTCLMGPHPA